MPLLAVFCIGVCIVALAPRNLSLDFPPGVTLGPCQCSGVLVRNAGVVCPPQERPMLLLRVGESPHAISLHKAPHALDVKQFLVDCIVHLKGRRVVLPTYDTGITIFPTAAFPAKMLVRLLGEASP